MTERTTYATGVPSWVDLSTPDLAGALQFYGRLFGWELEDAGPEAGHYHQARLRGRRVAGIGPAQPGGPPIAFWTTYFAGQDADAHAQAIREAGGTVVFGPADIFDQGRMLVAAEPQGAMFGVWEPRAHPGSELVNEDGAPTWNELYTRDLGTSRSFYGAVFGHTFEPLPQLPDGYSLVKVGDDVVAGMVQLTDALAAPETPPYWLTYFELADVDAGFARVRELGGELLNEPRDSPYGRWAPARDPQGGVFALIHGART